MSELIYLDTVRANISQVDLERLFEREERFEGTLAELLLNNPATVVYHMNPDVRYDLGDKECIQKLILGANYHGVDGGKHKIIVQNIPERIGAYVLFRPPNSDETTFYLADITFPFLESSFQEEIKDSPIKIKRWYLHRGNPLQIFRDFESRGFTFKDEMMSNERYSELMALASIPRD